MDALEQLFKGLSAGKTLEQHPNWLACYPGVKLHQSEHRADWLERAAFENCRRVHFFSLLAPCPVSHLFRGTLLNWTERRQFFILIILCIFKQPHGYCRWISTTAAQRGATACRSYRFPVKKRQGQPKYVKICSQLWGAGGQIVTLFVVLITFIVLGYVHKP